MQAIEALNGADVNLFCCDTSSKQDRPILFFFLFYLFLYLFQKPKHLFKENMQSKFKFASRRNLTSKDSLIKMPLHAKLSPFAYVNSGERSANRPKQ